MGMGSGGLAAEHPGTPVANKFSSNFAHNDAMKMNAMYGAMCTSQ